MERRASILAAAGDLFRERGYEATTTAQICHRAGCLNGTLFHLFKSKAAIREVLLGEVRQSYATTVEAALARKVPVHLALAAVIGSHLRWVEQNPAVARLIYILEAAIWDLDGEDKAPLPLRSVLTDLRRQVGQLPGRKVSGAELVTIVFGAAEAASRSWLTGDHSRRLDILAGPLAAAAMAGVASIRAGYKKPAPADTLQSRGTSSTTRPDERDLLHQAE